MAAVELLMPKMGESIIEATILGWLKSEGETIDMDEPICEIATDKVDSEVPSEVSGVITKLLYKEGDVVAVGAPLAIIEVEGAVASAPQAVAAPVAETPQAVAQVQEQIETVVQEVAPAAVSISASFSGRFYSPLVLNIAKEEQISMQELDTIPGTGKDNRVTKNDIKTYLESRPAGGFQVAPQQAAAKPIQTIAQPSAPVTPVVKALVPVATSGQATTSVSGNVEVIEMDRMRKLIAKHMVNSVQTSAHVTSFVEADVTNIVNWRNKIKDSFAKREGEKITFTPIFIEAVAKAIKDFPQINCSIQGDNILMKKDINIGMAAALPSGNLIVPVVKNADQLNLTGITKKVNDLANRARAGKLKPDEIDGGTFTLTNVGSFGNVMGTPIINQPQVAILAVGIIKKKPVVIETPQGDVIGIRSMMFLSHSYDHRVVDGALGGKFVRRVADYLEQFDVNREF
ncbi:MAG: 2-oxoglutarate dehydrogenase E2 component (dihydrolipoamide succinyltransferase) [Planctomycetota bacterium]|jgi:2-oxoglutarate dehydrogenase E2 component (dihydrolipoamide succinyltransferase)